MTRGADHMSVSFVTKPKKGKQPVIQQIKTAEGTLVLLDPASSKEPTFENLFLRRGGRIKWKAELPQSHDAFASIDITDTGETAADSQNILTLGSYS
jgi:hypothetical protein